MTFSPHLDLEYIDGTRWKLTEAFSYKTNAGDTILVPAGFVTDFASVPKFMFWRRNTGSYGKAAVIHDSLYQFNGVTRSRADAIFLEAMTNSGVGWFTRHSFYLGVRLGGWKPWNAYRSQEHTV